MTPERLKEIRRRFSRDKTSLWLKEHGGMLDAIDDLLAHVDALENDPLTVRSHIAVRKRDMKVFDCDAAERLARLVLEERGQRGMTVNIKHALERDRQIEVEARRVLGES